MDNPKLFYRELDALLAKIGKNKRGKNFLTSIFVELGDTFGETIGVSSGGIYEDRKTSYVQIYSTNQYNLVQKIPADSSAILETSDHSSFIFDHPEWSVIFGSNNNQDYTPATIKVSSAEKKWLLVFCLKPNWVREEVTLFLNSVQTALNYRLFSDIMHDELEQAEEIQKSLLPQKSPKFSGYDIYGRSIPAELVGGDFYEYFNFDEGNFGISIGDASGHGLPAALLVRDVVIGLRMGLASEYKLVFTLKKLNRVIQQSTFASNFVSLFIGEMEKDGHLFFVNAGHPSPFLVSGKTVIELKPTGIVLGFVEDIKLYRSHIYMVENSVLVMYTDGIIERDDGTENQFGIENLQQLVKEHQSKNAREIVEVIYDTVFKYGRSVNWEDDATVVVIKMNGTHK
jgi:Stage II sporulation protein E (SpoIIE)